MARLVYQRGTSAKFWDGTVTGSAMTVHFGRIGTTGQTCVTTCGSPAAAATLLANVTAAKRAKG